jgi:hypothetical protein
VQRSFFRCANRQAGEGAIHSPAHLRLRHGAQVALQRCLYSGSEGEMLKKEISTVVASARCGKCSSAVVQPCVRLHCGQGPAATNCRARHSMSEDRAPSGRCADFTASANFIESRSPSFAVQYGKLDSAGIPWLRIALPDTRCPRIELRAAGCALLPKRILRCRLEE